MGQQQSKGELLYQQANRGNIRGIICLRLRGSGLETDMKGKTALIVACMSSDRYDVAKTLIELGANVNAYSPTSVDSDGGTPLQHAAKRGLDQTVKLLLSHGANALMANYFHRTPLDVARSEGHTSVVRTIENHICLFSGCLREIYSPGSLEVLAPKPHSRKAWVFVLPYVSRKHDQKPFGLELVIYPTKKPCRSPTFIELQKGNLVEPNFTDADPAVIIYDNPDKIRIKLASANETDKQELQRFFNACKVNPQVEDIELAMAISASIRSAAESRPPINRISEPSTSSVNLSSTKASSNGSQTHEVGSSSSNPSPNISKQNDDPNVVLRSLQTSYSINSLPSAPLINFEEMDNNPILYSSIDFSPFDFSTNGEEISSNSSPTIREENKIEDFGASSTTCVICLDVSVEGACVPCGHMAGCMSCLNEIKSKKMGCPLCRAKIDQVIRIYAV